MTNSELLIELIESKGIKLAYLKDALDISYSTLRRKINNESCFTAGEIEILCECLDLHDLELKEAIFFTKNVDKMPT